MHTKTLAGIGVAVAVILISVLILNQPPVETIPNYKIGLVINPPQTSTSIQELNSVYQQAASTGIGRSNVYLFWNNIEPIKNEYDWQNSDILMSFNKKNDLKVTLFFSIINGKTLGPFPDWIGRPTLNNLPQQNLINTLDAILSRYDIIDTVIIAGETDEHFRYNEQSIPVYNKLFSNVYNQIKEKHPDVKIANAFSLHGIINKHLSHIVKEVEVGDFVAFNYLPVNSLNDIIKSPKEARNDLDKMLELAGDNKIGIFEISWSTSDFVNGSENNQAKFVKEVFDFYSDNQQKIEFITWYRQFDKPEGTCQTTPEETGSVEIGGTSSLGSSEFVIERLGYYLCSAGLLDNSGNPKPAWNEFQSQIKNLR